MKNVEKIFINNTMMFLLIIVAPGNVNGQVQIGEGTVVAVGPGSVATNGSVSNRGDTRWNTESYLYLTGEGVLETNDPLELHHLIIKGDYVVYGTVHINTTLDLVTGILTPAQDAQLIIGPVGDAISTGQSYVNGILYRQGPGIKFYPIGKKGEYTPVTLNDVVGDEDVMVGLEAFNQDIGLSELPEGIRNSSPNWYWEIKSSGNFSGSRIQLPVTEADSKLVLNNSEFTIMQTDGTSSSNLGGNNQVDLTVLESLTAAMGPYILLGYGRENSLLIHNIITPTNADDVNDRMVIENIEAFGTDNTVILLDRWGTEVCRIENFSNDMAGQNGCDVSKLPAGNYICLVRYGDRNMPPTMVTIIN